MVFPNHSYNAHVIHIYHSVILTGNNIPFSRRMSSYFLTKKGNAALHSL